MKQGKKCDISGGQCKSGLELASSAKGRQAKICDISGGGVGWVGCWVDLQSWEEVTSWKMWMELIITN